MEVLMYKLQWFAPCQVFPMVKGMSYFHQFPPPITPTKTLQLLKHSGIVWKEEIKRSPIGGGNQLRLLLLPAYRHSRKNPIQQFIKKIKNVNTLHYDEATTKTQTGHCKIAKKYTNTVTSTKMHGYFKIQLQGDLLSFVNHYCFSVLKLQATQSQANLYMGETRGSRGNVIL